ncbi:50S ribosomal protein L27 [Candidatus Peregrinibacteria bacterium]|nr:50S ribosomal protein L27 [Candidatus Peregrinibacteria bacterium]
MAHKKAGGTTTNGRDSRAKRRGVKRFGGQVVSAGEVLVRQKGSAFVAGKNTYIGRDWTIHASLPGVVGFSKAKRQNFNGNRTRGTFVHVTPSK